MDHAQLGQIFYDEKKYDMAIEEFSKAINLDPNNPGLLGLRGYAYKGRGQANENLNDFDLAIDDFNMSIMVSPTAFAYCALGILYGYKQDFNTAFMKYNESLKLDPNYSEAYLHRGVLYAGNGDFKRAISDWESVLRIEPDNYAAKSFLSKVR
jgi:tetratricopeptide (TPR) repeat protein